MLIPMYFKNCTDLNNKREKGKGFGEKRKEKRPPYKNIKKIKNFRKNNDRTNIYTIPSQ